MRFELMRQGVQETEARTFIEKALVDPAKRPRLGDELAGRYRALILEIQTPRDLLPYEIVVRGRGWDQRLEVAEQGVLEVDLPDPPETPEVIELRMKGQSFEPDPSVLGVRVGFREKP